MRTTNQTNKTLPDLIISNLTFKEYIPANDTNSTRVRIDVTIMNIGEATADSSTTLLIGLLIGEVFTKSLTSGDSSIHFQDYECIRAHHFNATADYYNVLNESNEGNNIKSTIIDCIL